MRQSQLLAVAVEVGFDQVRRESIVAGGDRGVGRERQLRGYLEGGLVERARGTRRQMLAGKLERQERRMAFVHVQDVGLGIRRQDGPQRAQTTDAEHDLLANAGVLIAAVQVAGDPAVVLAVVGQIGVQQIQRHAPNRGHPDAGEHGAARERDLDDHWCARRIQDRAYGERVGVEPIVGFALVASIVDDLAEVSVAVQQPDGDQRQAQVTGCLEVVASQHTQPARVNRQRLGNCELGAEVGDAWHVLHVWRTVEVLLQIAISLEDALGVLGQAIRIVGG